MNQINITKIIKELSELIAESKNILPEKVTDYTTLDNMPVGVIKHFIETSLLKVLDSIDVEKKTTITNMLQDDDVFFNRGIDGVKGYNQKCEELKDIIKSLKT